jgi:hypothetical protein
MGEDERGAGDVTDFALERARDQGFSHVILDGKVIACDRCKEPATSVTGEVIDLWYSGKAHAHGGNIQAVLAPGARPIGMQLDLTGEALPRHAEGRNQVPGGGGPWAS